MTRLDCRFGVLNAGLGTDDLDGLGEFIASHFRAASGGNIELNCVAPVKLTEQIPSARDVSAYDLHRALSQLTKNPIQPPISRIGLLLAHRYGPYPETLGVMFDRGFSTEDDSNSGIYSDVPREGCALFLGAIRALRQGADYRSEVRFTAVHELGHVFNLQHKSTPSTFMLTSNLGAPHGPDAYFFDHEQQDWLAQCPDNPAVMPGGLRFMQTGTSNNVPDRHRLSAADGSLKLKADIHPREFWRFEPAQLDVALALAPGSKRPVKVPDEFDPGYERFRIFIEDPRGERRLYRSPRHFCNMGRATTIESGKSFRRDIPLFGQSGGYTFRSAGVHRVVVEFQVSARKVLCSNTVEILVKAETGRDPVRDRARQALTDPHVAQVLFHRADLKRAAGLARLDAYLEHRKAGPAAATLNYIWSRTVLSRMQISKQRSPELRAKAVVRLKRAMDDVHLGAHRARRASAVLTSLADAP